MANSPTDSLRNNSSIAPLTQVVKKRAVLHLPKQRKALENKVSEDTERERMLDEELDQTFPASDPLPWSHQVN